MRVANGSLARNLGCCPRNGFKCTKKYRVRACKGARDGWWFGFAFGGRRALLSAFGLAFVGWLVWPLRWHSRFGFALASAIRLCAGIRELLACFMRRPCAGRHLLFFAAAKKSRQKKAAHTASSSSCLRAPKGSYTSHGNHVIDARCQRSEQAPHLLRTPALTQAAANGTCRPGGKLCVGCRTAQVSALTRNTSPATQSGVVRVWRESRHTVCHLGGGGLPGAAC